LNVPTFDPASFRDPSGRVLHHEGRVFRTISPRAVERFEFVRQTRLFEDFAENGKILPIWQVDNAEAGNPHGASLVLETNPLPFVFYPFEWCFDALKAAALLHLDIHLEALSRGITMSDASAYNVQFIGSKPVFIDHLSFQPYVENEIWTGHAQFCDHFLNPLVLAAGCGVDFNPWLRGSQEGIPAIDLRAFILFRSKLSWPLFVNIELRGKLDQSVRNNSESLDEQAMARGKLPKAAFINLLQSLRK